MSSTGARTVPMFPLGTVLFPRMMLPLHVFEPRYRALLADVLAGDGTFGVTLIERGSEVGGGDVRTDLGTIARVVEARELDDGRWVLLAVGTSRVRVLRWLEDDPYPRAALVDEPDAPAGPRAGELRDRVAGRLRTILSLRSPLGESDGPGALELDADPAAASWEASVLAAANPFDAQRLLAAASASDRLELLLEVLDDTEAALRFALDAPAPPTDD